MKFLMVFFIPVMMFGHSLSVTASYENKELFIESYFGNGNPCKGCDFTITYNNDEIYKNKLADDGSFENIVELQTPFRVDVDGGMGHLADVEIDGDEMGEKLKQIDNTTNASTTMNNIDEAKIREIIRGELNKQNAKIEVIVEKNRSTLEKMLVGLGYILGIFGLWQLIAQRVQK